MTGRLTGRLTGRALSLFLLLALVACDSEHGDRLPGAVSNNAVVAVIGDGTTRFYSFNGIGAGKSWRDTGDRAFEVDPISGQSTALPPVPGGIGRLASTAAVVGGMIYVFGGYSVAEDGTEISTRQVFRFDPATRQYTAMAPMPVPVDDAVAVTYGGRYIYLVGGWSNSGNVSLVQVYDSATNRWARASFYPGPPVFGHAGGIVGNTIIIADGVAVTGYDEKGRRQFGASTAAYRGTIDPGNVAIIDWQPVAPHDGPPLYRMAAAGLADAGLVVFAGGSDNPYNYNGIGYDGRPSAPSARVFAYDVGAGGWRDFKDKPVATMDHRGLLRDGDKLCTLGGMTADQQVTGALHCFSLK